MSKQNELKKLKSEISSDFVDKKLVFGFGNLDTRIVFVGEAPGREEEIQGKPFVGRAGRLLNSALENAAIKREEVYITNVVKFRPVKGKDNRKPSKKEVKLFVPFLLKELKIIKPKIVCILGATALQVLTDKKDLQGITKLRGKIMKINNLMKINNFYILPTFHPAAVLRNPNLKKNFFDDIKKLKKFY